MAAKKAAKKTAKKQSIESMIAAAVAAALSVSQEDIDKLDSPAPAPGAPPVVSLKPVLPFLLRYCAAVSQLPVTVHTPLGGVRNLLLAALNGAINDNYHVPAGLSKKDRYPANRPTAVMEIGTAALDIVKHLKSKNVIVPIK